MRLRRYSTSRILEIEVLEIPVLLNQSSWHFYCLLWVRKNSYKPNLVKIGPLVSEIWVCGMMEVVHSQQSSILCYQWFNIEPKSLYDAFYDILNANGTERIHLKLIKVTWKPPGGTGRPGSSWSSLTVSELQKRPEMFKESLLTKIWWNIARRHSKSMKELVFPFLPYSGKCWWNAYFAISLEPVKISNPFWWEITCLWYSTFI